MPPRLLVRLAVVFFAACVAVPSLQAGSVNLTWNQSPSATGYKVYSGGGSGSYDSNTDVGGANQTEVSGMPDCTPTYFAVTAYNVAGESGYSSEISSWPRPVVSGTSDADGRRGEQISLVITGVNFHSGATVQFSNPDVSVDSVSVDACGQVTASITIGASAPFGPTEISVVNPNGVTGTAAGLFEVVGDPLPPVENLRRDDVLPPA